MVSGRLRLQLDAELDEFMVEHGHDEIAFVILTAGAISLTARDGCTYLGTDASWQDDEGEGER